MQDKLTESIDPSHHHHGKRIVGSRARVGPRDSAKGKPEIHVNNGDGRVESIVISCTCGEQITVVCEYAD